MHEVLVDRLGGLSLPRKSVVRLTDRPDMTLDVYRGRKTTIQYNTTRCTWICPKCDSSNFLDSFFDDQLNLMTENRFDPLSKDNDVRLSSNSSKETNYSNKTLGRLKLISIYINSIRGKRLDLLAFLEVHQP